MGTNYYLVTKAEKKCDHCGHIEPATKLHIGKSSLGWCFSLQVIPEMQLNTLQDWRTKFNAHDHYIEDEYGSIWTVDAMMQIITDRALDRNWDDDRWYRSFYNTEDYFHACNQSERGPNGLLRHKINGRDCIGHGAGTWDLIAGEFS